MNRIAFFFGTRPEIIKLAPIIRAAELDPELEVLVISTGQHREMAAQALESFGLIPEIDLSLMTENQTPTSFLAALLSRLEGVLLAEAVDYVVVQGDTTSALGGALTAFHLQLPIAHVEAGLRTYDLASPFPEEMNRSVISKLATLHFCPTPQAAENLAREGITEHVFTVGNSIVDALQMIDSALLSGKAPLEKSVYDLNVTERRYLPVSYTHLTLPTNREV